MKILIISLHADPSIAPGAEEGGGTHMYISELMNMFIIKQVEALIITRKASVGDEVFKYGTVKLIRLPIGPAKQWDKSNLENLESELNDFVLRTLNQEKFIPDIIHSVYWHSGRVGIHLSNIFNKPLIYTVISNGLRKQLNGYNVSEARCIEELRIFQKAQLIISICNEEKEDLIKLYGIDKQKIRVVGRGVDNIFLQEIYDEKGTLISNKPLNIIENESR
jgi:D-inositol-3-phosphate glycosyltransferase